MPIYDGTVEPAHEVTNGPGYPSTSHAHCVPRQDYDALMAQFNAVRQVNANLAAEIKRLQQTAR